MAPVMGEIQFRMRVSSPLPPMNMTKKEEPMMPPEIKRIVYCNHNFSVKHV